MRIKSAAIGVALLAGASLCGLSAEARSTEPPPPSRQSIAAAPSAPSVEAKTAASPTSSWDMISAGAIVAGVVYSGISAGAAVVGVVVSGIGLLFIYRQLQHGRSAILASTEAAKAAAQAAEIAFGETRPWLTLEMGGTRGLGRGKLLFSQERDGRTPIEFQPLFANIGKTPALSVGIAVTVLDDPNDIHEAWAEMLQKGVPLGKALFPGAAISYGYLAPIAIPPTPAGQPINLILLIGVLYRSRAGGPWHGTPYVTVATRATPLPPMFGGATPSTEIFNEGADIDIELFSGTDLEIGPT